MSVSELVKPLLRVALFQGLKPLQLTEIARRAERIVYKPGDKIIGENEEGDAAILVVSGEVRRVAGVGVGGEYEVVPPGSLLGEMAMLVETEHSSTIVAHDKVRALRITREALHEQMAEDNGLAQHFVKAISARLSAIAEELRAVDRILAGPMPVGEAPPTLALANANPAQSGQRSSTVH